MSCCWQTSMCSLVTYVAASMQYLSMANQHRWARLLIQRNVDFCCRFRYIATAAYIYIYIYTFIYIYFIYVYAAVSNGKRKTEAQAIFLKQFTVCSSCKRKFVVCPSVYEETNGSYPFANKLNRLTELPISAYQAYIIRQMIYQPG